MELKTERLRLIPLNAVNLKLLIDNQKAMELKLSLSHSDEILSEELRQAMEYRLTKVVNDKRNYLWNTNWLIVSEDSNCVIGGIMLKGLPNANGEVIKEAHMSLEDLLITLDNLGQPVLFVGMDVTIHWEHIKEVLRDKVQRVNAAFDLPNAAVLVEMAKKMEPSEVHTVVPEYLRITEAEANWMKEQKKNGK